MDEMVSLINEYFLWEYLSPSHGVDVIFERTEFPDQDHENYAPISKRIQISNIFTNSSARVGCDSKIFL